MTYQNQSNSLWSRLSRSVGRFPIDLVAVFVFTLLAGGALVVASAEATLLRAALGVPLLLFVPGYVVVATAFPGDGRSVAERNMLPNAVGEAVAPDGIDGVERAALSFGASVVLVPLVALALVAIGSPLDGPAIVSAYVAIGCVGAVVAAVRRSRLPQERRYRVPVDRWIADLRASVFGTDRRFAGVVNVVLLLSVLVATASIGYALAAPQDGESTSSIALLTENEQGELEADGYPTNFTAGQPEELTVSVENEEDAETTYTVVAVVQRVDRTGDGVRVLEQRELDRMEATVEGGETWRQRHQVAPEMIGEDLRLTYFLYRGEAPETASEDTAYTSVYLSIDVDE